MKRFIALLVCCLISFMTLFVQGTAFTVYADETDSGDVDILDGATNMFVTQSSSLFRLSLDSLNIQQATSGAGATTSDMATNWVECDIVKVTADSKDFSLNIKDNKQVTVYSGMTVTKGTEKAGSNNAVYFAFYDSQKQLNFGLIASESTKAISVYSNRLENIAQLDEFKDKVETNTPFTEGMTSTFDLSTYKKPISQAIFDGIIGGTAKYGGGAMTDVQYKIYRYDSGKVTNFMDDAKGGKVSSSDELTYNAATGTLDGWKAVDTDYNTFNGWMSADTSSVTGTTTSQCYVIFEIKFKSDVEDIKAGEKDDAGFFTYYFYGTMWIAPSAVAEGENVLLLYASPDLSTIGSAVEKSGGAANTVSNMSNSANMVNWDTYDVKNDVDIGDNLGTIQFDERDLDDATLSRLAEIRRELQFRKSQSTKDWFDIVMKIGGIVVLIYTIAIGVAYVFDISNTVFDIELMRIVTFNRVVCVRDNDDLKYIQEKGSTQFLLTKKYFIIYMIVGILLSVFMLNTDIIRVVAESIFTVLSQ